MLIDLLPFVCTSADSDQRGVDARHRASASICLPALVLSGERGIVDDSDDVFWLQMNKFTVFFEVPCDAKKDRVVGVLFDEVDENPL